MQTSTQQQKHASYECGIPEGRCTTAHNPGKHNEGGDALDQNSPSYGFVERAQDASHTNL